MKLTTKILIGFLAILAAWVILAFTAPSNVYAESTPAQGKHTIPQCTDLTAFVQNAATARNTPRRKKDEFGVYQEFPPIKEDVYVQNIQNLYDATTRGEIKSALLTQADADMLKTLAHRVFNGDLKDLSPEKASTAYFKECVGAPKSGKLDEIDGYAPMGEAPPPGTYGEKDEGI